MKEENYYEVLGVEEDASGQDIKQSFRHLAKKFHPDLNNQSGSEEIFKLIQKAYEVLSDNDLRAEYDSILEQKRVKEDEDTQISSKKSVFDEGYVFKTMPVTKAEYDQIYRTKWYEEINFISLIRKLIALLFLVVGPAFYMIDTGSWNNVILYYGWLILFNLFSKLLYSLTSFGLLIWFIISLFQGNGRNVLIALGVYLLITLIFWLLVPHTFSDV